MCTQSKADQNLLVRNTLFIPTGRRTRANKSIKKMSLKAPSKFSTSLACISLLEREATLLSTFHTCLLKTHCSVQRSTQTDREQCISSNVLHLKQVGDYTSFDQRRYSVKRSLAGSEPNYSKVLFFFFYIMHKRQKRDCHPSHETMHIREEDEINQSRRWKALQLLENEAFFSYIGSADFPGVSIATATSHSLTEQCMTHTYL